jgi:hypothetical protein
MTYVLTKPSTPMLLLLSVLLSMLLPLGLSLLPAVLLLVSWLQMKRRCIRTLTGWFGTSTMLSYVWMPMSASVTNRDLLSVGAAAVHSRRLNRHCTNSSCLKQP